MALVVGTLAVSSKSTLSPWKNLSLAPAFSQLAAFCRSQVPVGPRHESDTALAAVTFRLSWVAVETRLAAPRKPIEPRTKLPAPFLLVKFIKGYSPTVGKPRN